MNRKAVALTLLGVMTGNLILGSVNTYGATSKTSQNPVIEVEYSTGTQANAKEKLDEKNASADENDGSYEEVILVEDKSTEEDEWEDIHVASVEDLQTLARLCQLDSWSVNKHVYLDADIYSDL